MPIPERAKLHPPFEIVPGVGIGPFRLGMTETEVEAICREYGLRNEGVLRSGLCISFHKGRAVQIDAGGPINLSIAGETFDSSDDTVRRLLAKIAPPGPDWTEMEGLFVTHYELSDDFVFSFCVYAPGHRVYVPEGGS